MVFQRKNTLCFWQVGGDGENFKVKVKNTMENVKERNVSMCVCVQWPNVQKWTEAHCDQLLSVGWWGQTLGSYLLRLSSGSPQLPPPFYIAQRCHCQALSSHFDAIGCVCVACVASSSSSSLSSSCLFFSLSLSPFWFYHIRCPIVSLPFSRF